VVIWQASVAVTAIIVAMDMSTKLTKSIVENNKDLIVIFGKNFNLFKTKKKGKFLDGMAQKLTAELNLG